MIIPISVMMTVILIMVMVVARVIFQSQWA